MLRVSASDPPPTAATASCTVGKTLPGPSASTTPSERIAPRTDPVARATTKRMPSEAVLAGNDHRGVGELGHRPMGVNGGA